MNYWFQMKLNGSLCESYHTCSTGLLFQWYVWGCSSPDIHLHFWRVAFQLWGNLRPHGHSHRGYRSLLTHHHNSNQLAHNKLETDCESASLCSFCLILHVLVNKLSIFIFRIYIYIYSLPPSKETQSMKLITSYLKPVKDWGSPVHCTVKK